MKKFLMIPALVGLLATGCGGTSEPGATGLVAWPEDVKEEMATYLGEELLLVSFNKDTFYHEYDADIDCYILGDYNTVNLLSNYGSRLLNSGWSEATDQDGETYYSKESLVGLLELYAGYYPADETQPAGNEIQVYVTEEGGGDTPVEGTYTIKITDYGWENQTKNPSGTAAPGFSISTYKNGGNNDPVYLEGTSAEDKCLRLYAQNSVTFSAENITEISFVYTRSDASFTPDTGSLSSDKSTWTGNASSVTFNLGTSGQIRIKEMTVTGTFSGGGDTPVDPPVGSRTVASIAEDIINLLYEDPDPSTDIDWDGNDAYITYLSSQTTLEDACIEADYFMPEYLSLIEEPTAGTWEDDGSDGYFSTYEDEENSIFVEVGTYMYGNDVAVQICVYTE